MSSSLFDETIGFCCRMDGPPNLPIKVPNINPFTIFPVYSTCPLIQKAVGKAYVLALELYSTPNVIGALRPFYKFSFNSISTLFELTYCYYRPENNADSLTFENPGPIRFNAYFSLQVIVKIKSEGQFVTSGVDANKICDVSLVGLMCSIQSPSCEFVRGVATITVLKCDDVGYGTLTVTLKTTLGVRLTADMNLIAKQNFNVLLLVSGDSSSTEIETDKSVIPINFFKTQKDFLDIVSPRLDYDSSNSIHLLCIIEQKSAINTVNAISLAYRLPVIIFDVLTTYADLYNDATEVRFVTPPERSNFRFILTMPQVKNSSGIVTIRTINAFTHREFFSIFRENISLLMDIVVTNDIKSISGMLKDLKSMSNITIIFILNSRMAIDLLTTAIELAITPKDGYLWISFSPNKVISNTFIANVCLHSNPPCHVAFDTMWNFIHIEQHIKCTRTDFTLSRMSKSITNLSDIIYNDLAKLVAKDIEYIVKDLQEKVHTSEEPFTSNDILHYLDSINCLQSGSGLRLTRDGVFQLDRDHPYFKKTDVLKWREACQHGWTGTFCHEPICTRFDCNSTQGVCIAPEICNCKPRFFGSNCDFNCDDTCVHGTCDEGIFGNGECLSCHWLYTGKRCDGTAAIFGFFAAGLGTIVCGFFLMLYIIRHLQTQEHNAVAEIETPEEQFTLKWDDLETTEDVNFSGKVIKRQLKEKIKYTSYMKAVTFAGHDIFIKYFERPDFQLTLGMKTELDQLIRLEHNNIEKLISIIIGESRVGIVTPISTMGSLYDVLHQKHIPIQMEVKYSIMQDICRAMVYLHDVVKIEHGRLKSTNCILHRGM